MELTFDFPISENEIYKKNIVEEIDNNQEIIDTTKKTVHKLVESEEDALEINTLVSNDNEEDADLQFELKSIDDKDVDLVNEVKLEVDIQNQEISPLNASIADFKKTTEARKMHLKKHNYTFHKNPSNIDEIEKEPAYKRQNIDLEDNPSSNENVQSRTTVDFDSEDEIQLRSNNSFLHDNVD
jgi:cell division protein FtsZ